MGEGEFLPAPVADDLVLMLKQNSATNGVVAPEHPMPLAEYRAALAATRNQWSESEDSL